MNASYDISLVVISFNMARELPRTLHSLSPRYQRDIRAEDYEVIVIDNGSREPPSAQDFAGLGMNLKVLSHAEPTPSPVNAINYGLSLCSAPLVGVMIDGARLASPGLLAACRQAARLHPRPVVATLSFHLGPGLQWITMQSGYDPTWEDRLLASIDWPDDGYRLFEIAPASENAPKGWFGPLNETNALFMPPSLWQELGGYDPAFTDPGGGYANPDLLWRALDLPDTRQVVVLGEGTFHQYHGGIATNSGGEGQRRLKEMSRTYYRLRRKPIKVPDGERTYFGPVSKAATVAYRRALGGGGMVSATPYPSTAAGPVQTSSRYVDLLKKTLLNETGIEMEAALRVAQEMRQIPPDFWREVLCDPPGKLRLPLDDIKNKRMQGQDTDAFKAVVPLAYTMIGRRRLDHLEACVGTVLDEEVPGDFMECGVWRGGACILIKGMLAERGITNRLVWLADSFDGLPPPRPGVDDALDLSKARYPLLAVSLDRVRANFETFGLLDSGVRFLPGWFEDSLPTAPVERLALLRIDGDLYSSTLDALSHLYGRVAPGGFVIVDDYGALPQCARAVDEFRAGLGIDEPLRMIDCYGAFWRKTR